MYGENSIPVREMRNSGMTPNVVKYFKSLEERIQSLEERIQAQKSEPASGLRDFDAMSFDDLKAFVRDQGWNGADEGEINLRMNETNLREAVKARAAF